MSRVTACLFSLLFSSFIFAQEPGWLDPASRAANFPDEEYLSAFATEILGKNQSETQAQSKLFEIIKSQISDEISVSINAQTTLNITVENAATDQKLERKSASSSEVELVGLKLDSYFEKRKKSLHAFAYVSIEELANYHRNVINQNTSSIESNLRQTSTSTNKLEKVELHVENKRLLIEIQKSARLLTALSESHGANLSDLKQIAAKNEQRLDQLFHTGAVALEHISARLSGELLNGIRKGSSESVAIAPFTYSNSGVESAFSKSLKQNIESTVSEASKISVNSSSKGQLSGSFILNKSETVYGLKIVNEQSEVLSSTEFAVLTNIIETKGLEILPPNFALIPDLNRILIEGQDQVSIKPSAYTTDPITLSYSLDDSPVTNLSLKISIENDGDTKAFKATSDANGKVEFYLDETMVTPGTDYLATFEIDLPDFLSIDAGNDFLKTIDDNQNVPQFKNSISVLSPLVWITSAEYGINGPLSIKVLEPAVKAGLSDLRYAFTDDPNQADFNLAIDAKARKGQAGDIATLTFVDATISLVNKGSGKEIYKNSFFNIKGIGANFDVAQSSAFQKTKTKMVDDITYELEYNR